MKNLSRLLPAPMLAAVLLLACIPTNAARRVGASPYDGSWSVAIYTLRGDCGSVRVAARIVGGRVYSADQSYQANGRPMRGVLVKSLGVRWRHFTPSATP
jgi:hypothetical protein